MHILHALYSIQAPPISLGVGNGLAVERPRTKSCRILSRRLIGTLKKLNLN